MFSLRDFDFYFVYRIFAILITTAGFWMIFKKCGKKGWRALVPGFRYYKLAECAYAEKEGIVCMVLELVEVVLTVISAVKGRSSGYYGQLALFNLVLLLTELLYRLRIFSGICRVFGRNKKWLLLWGPVTWAGAMVFGFGRNFQPVNLGYNPDNDMVAGTSPAKIYFDSHINSVSPEGLTVILKDRTVRDMTKKRYLLKDIYFTIPPRSLVLLLGGSGAGKTTLINAILGYEKANASIYLNGVNIYDHYEQMKYRIGFVPQQDLLRGHDTVYNTLQDAAKLRMPAATTSEGRKSRITDVMSVLGLSEGSTGLVSKKSGGMRKRISIGTELISDPELFILDEPDSGLDGVIARELFEKLRDIAHQGSIVIAITHTPDRVAEMFDQVIVLARDSGRVGRLVFSGKPSDAKEFFGKNSMEEIVMAINKKSEGGEGRADEFIEKYSILMNKQNSSPAKEADSHE